MRIGLVGLDSSHAEHFLRHFNAERRHRDHLVTAMWGPGTDAHRMAELLALAPAVEMSSSLGALIGTVDAVIVGDRHGDLHAPHAIPCLAAGKPVFIDKPLAATLNDAVAIVDAAERTGVPLLSASALRWQDDTVRLKARLATIGGPLEVRVYGTWYPQSEYGGPIFYAIHTVELAQEVFGLAWTDLRRATGPHPAVRCQCGRTSITLEFHPLDASGSSEFGVSIAAPDVTFEHPISLPDAYMRPVVDRFAEMLRTGRSPMTRETLLAPLKMMAEIDRLLGG